MSELLCPICGSARYRVRHPDTLGDAYPVFGYSFGRAHARTYRVVRCDDCGHAYASPRPADLWKHYQDVAEPHYLQYQAQRAETAKSVLKRIARWRTGGRLLDVGCATGDFLAVAAASYEAEGLELSDWAIRIARERGLTVHRSLLADLKPPRPYEVITLWGVIEHFERPVDEIRQMRRLLGPSGIVCVWTGDVGSWPARFLGKYWWYKQGQHIQMFSSGSLRKAFEDNGFERVWQGIYPHTTTFSSISQSLDRYPTLSGLLRGVLTRTPLARAEVTLSIPGEMFAIFRKIAGAEERK